MYLLADRGGYSLGSVFWGGRCRKLAGWGALASFGKVFSGCVPSSGEARDRSSVSWYQLKWTGGFLLQGGYSAEEFPEMLRSADSQLTAVWVEGRFSSPWLKPAKNVAVMYCFIFSKGGGCVA